MLLHVHVLQDWVNLKFGFFQNLEIVWNVFFFSKYNICDMLNIQEQQAHSTLWIVSIPNVGGELILDCIHVWTVFSLWIAFFFCQLSLANYYMTIYLIKAFDKIYIAAPFFCFLFFILLHNSFIPLKLGQLSFRMYKDIVHVLKNISLTCIFKLCIQGFNDICL